MPFKKFTCPKCGHAHLKDYPYPCGHGALVGYYRKGVYIQPKDGCRCTYYGEPVSTGDKADYDRIMSRTNIPKVKIAPPKIERERRSAKKPSGKRFTSTRQKGKKIVVEHKTTGRGGGRSGATCDI